MVSHHRSHCPGGGMVIAHRWECQMTIEKERFDSWSFCEWRRSLVGNHTLPVLVTQKHYHRIEGSNPSLSGDSHRKYC
jgi:hypothetical protein